MATKTRTKQTKADPRNPLLEYAVFVPLGATQLAVGKARTLTMRAWTMADSRRKDLLKGYDELAERGEKIVTSWRRSVYTQRAADQTKAARSQVRSAARSLRRAVGTTTEATRAAARRIG